MIVSSASASMTTSASCDSSSSTTVSSDDILSSSSIQRLQNILKIDDIHPHCTSIHSLLATIFHDVTSPSIYVDVNLNKLVIPDGYVIKIEGGSNCIYEILADVDLFQSFPLLLQSGMLDVMYLMLHRSPYDVSRFECYYIDCDNTNSSSSNHNRISINRLLLDLLYVYNKNNSGSSSSGRSEHILKRIIQLLGVTCKAGQSIVCMKEYLSLLKEPNHLTVSLLKALRSIFKYNNDIVKASPSAFFNFGGYSSGITSDPTPYPYNREYCIFTWFRIESFTNSNTTTSSNCSDVHWKQHIFNIRNQNLGGVDVYIDNRSIVVSIIDYDGTPSKVIYVDETKLTRGVWYHISIRHGRPRMTLFSKDELTIHIDHQLVYQGSVPLPNSANMGDVEFSVGRNFSGQICPVYFTNELLSPLIIETVARIDANKATDYASLSSGSIDFLTIVTPDRKSTNLTSKVVTVYHPCRCAYGHVLDVHGGRHARISQLTHCWLINWPKDIIASLGGLSCLMTLFTKLFIKSNKLNDGYQYNSNSNNTTESLTTAATSTTTSSSLMLQTDTSLPSLPTPFGSSLPSMLADDDCTSLFSRGTLERGHADDVPSDDGCIGLLLSIIVSFINHCKLKNSSMCDTHFTKFIEMIEYALLCIPPIVFQEEGDGCVLSVVQLQTAFIEHKKLYGFITKRVLFNFKIWSKGSFSFQHGLMSAILALIRVQPAFFITLISIETLLDYMRVHYMDRVTIESDVGYNSYTEKDKLATSALHGKASPTGASSTGIGTGNGYIEGSSSSGSAMNDDDSTLSLSSLSFLDIAMTSDDMQSMNTTARDKASEGDSSSIDILEGNDVPRSRVMTEVSDDGIHLGDHAVTQTTPKHGSEEETLCREQRRYLRECLQSMIVLMIQTSLSTSEIGPLLNFMTVCVDLVVLTEMGHLLLCLILENGSKVIGAITELCHGPEEFASFVLYRLINRDYEQLRCTGIRLITYFYQKLDSLPMSLLTLTMRGANNSVVTRAMDKISMLTAGQGMQRLHICGGLLALCDILKNYMPNDSNYLTYSALLEMLLTKPGSKSLVMLQNLDDAGQYNHDTKDCIGVSSVATSSIFLPRLLAFDLSPEQVTDDQSDMMNTYVLPFFINLLPKLPLAIQGDVLADLLTLLKHSSANRDAFSADCSWHICLSSIFSQFDECVECTGNLSYNPVPIYTIVKELNIDTGGDGGDGGGDGSISDSMSINADGANTGSNSRDEPSPRNVTFSKTNSFKQSLYDSSSDVSKDVDTWYAVGLKVYATILLHCIDYNRGWQEVEVALCQQAPRVIPQAILSHMVNDLSLTMKSRYKGIHTLIKSKHSQENLSAMDQLENLLSILIMSLQFCMMDNGSSSTMGVRHLHIGKLRVRYIHEATEEWKEKNSIEAQMRVDGFSVPNNSRRAIVHSSILFIAEERVGKKIQRSASDKCTSSSSSSSSSSSGSGSSDQSMHYLDFNHVWISPKAFKSATSVSPSNSDKMNRGGNVPGNSSGIYSTAVAASTKQHNFFGHMQPLERGHDAEEGNMTLMLQTIRLFDDIFWNTNTATLRNVNMLRFIKDRHSMQSNHPDSTGSSSGTGSSGTSSSDTSSKVDNLTLFSCMVKACIYVLTKISPLTDIAVLNVQRMQVLFKSSEKNRQHPIKTPVDDWLVAVLLHVTINLQRISVSLQQLYTMVGVKTDIKVPSYGSTYGGEATKIQQDSDDVLLVTLQEQPEVVDMLLDVFDAVPARNLMLFVRASSDLLYDIVQDHHDVLDKALDPHVIVMIEEYVDYYRSDFYRELPTPPPTPPSAAATTLDLTSSSVSNDKRVGSLLKLPFSGNISAVEDDMNTEQGHDQSYWQQQQQQQQHNNSTLQAIEYTGTYRTHCIISMLRLLRSQYMWVDLLRNVKVVRSLLALEAFELDCNSKYINNLDILRNHVTATTAAVSNDSGGTSGGDISELKHLYDVLQKKVTCKEKHRLMQKKAAESLHIKRAINSWQASLHVFDDSWSPYVCSSNNGLTGTDGKASYKLSMHRDRLKRRMLFFKFKGTDHSSAAYHDANKNRSDVDAVDHNMLKHLIKTKASTEMHWGEEDDDDDDDDDTDDNITAITTAADSNSAAVTSSGGRNRGISHYAGKAANDMIVGIGKFANLKANKPPSWTAAFNWSNDEVMKYIGEATKIELEHMLLGVILISNRNIYFHPCKQVGGLVTVEIKSCEDKQWRLDRLIEVYGRRHLLQNCAIELFFADCPEVLFSFNSPHILQKFYKIIRKQNTPLYRNPSKSLNPQQVFANSTWTDLWRRRLISNFEYILRLNIIAGRSYNDITQYPVFPWIIGDYKSQVLDLNSDSTYRDLSKPVGALNAKRLEEVLERYKSFGDDIGVPRFMFGSHYSSAGVVLHFMVRQEPFTTMAINLQGGRFDCPDRNFFDISSTWNGCNHSLSDVKELIPEMYCLPEMLLNTNKLPLGELQEGGVVNDVKLPPWAKNPYDFIRLNREALESDYVSTHLNDWIDLIFGYKQRGIEAEKANNLFYYLTYENCSININDIENQLLREATKSQVTHFGQTPSQLFSKDPHPKRLGRSECMGKLCHNISNINLNIYTPMKQLASDGCHGAAIAVQYAFNQLVVMYADFSLGYYKFTKQPDGNGNLFTVKTDRGRVMVCASHCISEEVMARKSHIPDPMYSKSFIPRDRDYCHISNDAHGKTAHYTTGSNGRSDASNSSSSSSSSGGSSDKPKSIISSMFGGFSFAFPGVSTTNSSNSTSASTNVLLSDDHQESKEDDVTCNDSTINSFEHQHIHNSNSYSTSSINLCLKSLPKMRHHHVALSIGDVYGRIITCGYWDDTLKVHSLDATKEIATSNAGHNGGVTCVQQGLQGLPTFITGGTDGICRVWVLECTSLASAFAKDLYIDDDEQPDSTLACLHSLYGHVSAITAIGYSNDLDIVVSASETGLLCFHTVSKGEFIRSVDILRGSSIDVVLATSPGYVVVHSWSDMKIHLFWINGQHIASDVVGSNYQTFIVNSDGNVLLCGCDDGSIVVRALWSLEIVNIDRSLQSHGAITSLCLSEDTLFIGSEDGSFSVGMDNDERIRYLQSVS